MWVKDGEQLQAMNTNLGGNYAFHNSIDLNSIKDLNSIENFKGNLDGLGYDIYGLHSKKMDYLKIHLILLFAILILFQVVLMVQLIMLGL